MRGRAPHRALLTRFAAVPRPLSPPPQAAHELEYRGVLAHVFGVLAKVASAPTPHAPGSLPTVAVFAETTAQHFPNYGGDYFMPKLPQAAVEASLEARGRGPFGLNRYECAPLQCELASAAGRSNATELAVPTAPAGQKWKPWRNRVAADVASRFPGVYVVPLGDVTASGLSDAHITSQIWKKGKPGLWG